MDTFFSFLSRNKSFFSFKNRSRTSKTDNFSSPGRHSIASVTANEFLISAHCLMILLFVPKFAKTSQRVSQLSPCHTKPCFHCVGIELINFPERREIARKPWYFSLKRACHHILTATKALLRSSHGALSHSYGVLVGDSLRSHDTFTSLSRHSQCALPFHGVQTALSAWWRHSFAQQDEVSSSVVLEGS